MDGPNILEDTLTVRTSHSIKSLTEEGGPYVIFAEI